MYSRYGQDWEPERTEPAPPRERSAPPRGGGLPSLLARFQNMDKGDMLLLAVLVFLLFEGEDMEIVVLLALILFLGK